MGEPVPRLLKMWNAMRKRSCADSSPNGFVTETEHFDGAGQRWMTYVARMSKSRISTLSGSAAAPVPLPSAMVETKRVCSGLERRSALFVTSRRYFDRKETAECTSAQSTTNEGN